MHTLQSRTPSPIAIQGQNRNKSDINRSAVNAAKQGSGCACLQRAKDMLQPGQEGMAVLSQPMSNFPGR